MKLCFPVETDNGLDSVIFNHFGSAPYFVVFDTEEKSLNTINNRDLNHIHGQCNPLKALNGKMVDAIIVGGIGAGAITRLNETGIKVYKAADGTIQQNIDTFQTNTMVEMTIKQACGGNGLDGECAH